MNRLHRFGLALFGVGGTGAGVCVFALMYSGAVPDLFWPALIAGVVCGVIAGVGYVIQETFADPDQPPGRPPRPPRNSPRSRLRPPAESAPNPEEPPA